MQGTITTTTAEQVTVHTYTAPAAGLAATTHLIELADQIFVVDTQYAIPFAAEAAAFAASLGKPVTRVYVTHAHPDHYFGAGEFDAPVYALPSVITAIAEHGEATRAGNKAAAGAGGSVIPDQLTVPTEPVTPGIETISGVRFEFREVHDTEADQMLVITIPDAGILLAGDIAYNQLHLFLAGEHLEAWRDTVRQLHSEGWRVILPGHGLPGGPEILTFVGDYLAAAAPILEEQTTPEGLKQALVDAFPTAGGTTLLDIQNGYFFPAAH